MAKKAKLVTMVDEAAQLVDEAAALYADCAFIQAQIEKEVGHLQADLMEKTKRLSVLETDLKTRGEKSGRTAIDGQNYAARFKPRKITACDVQKLLGYCIAHGKTERFTDSVNVVLGRLKENLAAAELREADVLTEAVNKWASIEYSEK